jgi:2-amino-4-hydroxy-6-hydroxymethyldihydropteridine diphosphokinase
MALPIRITYRQDADYFIEAHGQNPLANKPLIPEKVQNRLLVAFVLGMVLFECVKTGIEKQDIKLPILTAVFVLCIMGFWLWFFKKTGLWKTTPASPYRWTEKDRAGLEKRLRKRMTDENVLVCWEFDEAGFRFVPVTEKSAKYDWARVSRAVEAPRGLFFFLGRISHLWFPKTAFASAQDYAELLQVISRKTKEFAPFDVDQWAYVAVGSNVGNSTRSVQEAIGRLSELSSQPIFVSSLWQTAPVDCPPGSPNFVNAAVALMPKPEETPESLLVKLQVLEKGFGRKPKKVMNEPRPLDLDLIAFRREQRSSSGLILPHPRAQQRRFVLQPLAEIAPDLVLPGETKSVARLLAELPSDHSITKL